MTTQGQPERPSLDTVLAGQPVGTWVILDPDMTMVIGAAISPAEAIRNADLVQSEFNRAIGERPVLMQVPDPNMICLY